MTLQETNMDPPEALKPQREMKKKDEKNTQIRETVVKIAELAKIVRQANKVEKVEEEIAAERKIIGDIEADIPAQSQTAVWVEETSIGDKKEGGMKTVDLTKTIEKKEVEMNQKALETGKNNIKMKKWERKIIMNQRTKMKTKSTTNSSLW